MNKCVKITFQPIIWRDENLNNASAGIGSTTCHVFGETKEQLFENIKQKIWGMSSEARILDKEVAAEYNQWIADSWKAKSVPAAISGSRLPSAVPANTPTSASVSSATVL